MMTGTVTARREAVLRLILHDVSGQEHTYDTVIDTGYNGWLTLPPSVIAALGLRWQRFGRAILADGSESVFNIYEGVVLWDGQSLTIDIERVKRVVLWGRMGVMARKPYPSDLTDGQWQTIQSVLPKAKGGRTGRPRPVPLREVWNAIFYQARTGCAWRYLPHDLPPWERVWERFSRWRDTGLIEAVHDALREKVRIQEGRDPTPSAAILDSQSVKMTQKGGPLA